MNAVARVRAILFDPVVAWAVIEKDIGDPAYVLSRYVALLALIPALASFVGATLVGVIAPGGGIIRAGLVDGLFGAIFSYAMSCAMVLLLGLIIDLLAPTFGGRRDFEDAFKLRSSSRSIRSHRCGSPEFFSFFRDCVLCCSRAVTAFICSGSASRD